MQRLRAFLPLACLALAAAVRADISSLTDDFEQETPGLNYDSFANWDVLNGTVDVIPYLSGNCVDLDGSSGQSGTFVTKSAFAPGTYRLSFDLAGNQYANTDPNDVQVSFGTFSQTYTRQAGELFSTETATVTLTSSTSLSFYNPGDDDNGAYLDNVSVQAVPEPASLVALGLGGLALLRRRTRH